MTALNRQAMAIESGESESESESETAPQKFEAKPVEKPVTTTEVTPSK